MNEPQNIPEVGSRWYAWGHHQTVIGHTTRDGEPAVVVQRDGTKKPGPHSTIVASVFARRAVPSGG